MEYNVVEYDSIVIGRVEDVFKYLKDREIGILNNLGSGKSQADIVDLQVVKDDIDVLVKLAEMFDNTIVKIEWNEYGRMRIATMIEDVHVYR